MNIKKSFTQFKKDNARNLSILAQVFPLVKVLTKGGRVVQFSFERGHPIMRTFAAEQNVHLTAFGAGWRVRLANVLFNLGRRLANGGGR
mgnify:FL=1